jgi:hypothetical protein
VIILRQKILEACGEVWPILRSPVAGEYGSWRGNAHYWTGWKESRRLSWQKIPGPVRRLFPNALERNFAFAELNGNIDDETTGEKTP